jgi:endoglucanase
MTQNMRKYFLLGISMMLMVCSSFVSAEPDENTKIQNGNFIHGKTGWDFWISDSVKADFDVKEEKAVIKIISPGEKPWSIILNQGNLPIKKGKVYQISFTAAATPSMRISMHAGMSVSPYYSYSGARYFTLTPVMRNYTCTFTMRQESDFNSVLQFRLGCTGTGTIYFDDIRITCLGDASTDIIHKTFVPPEKPAMKQGIQFGLQLASPFEGAYAPEFREEYFDIIKKDGRFDNIRLPVWWEYNTQKTPPYIIDPVFMKRVDWAVSNSLHRGFYTILNMHWFRELEKNPVQNKAQFLATWKQIAEYFKDYPDYLYFDILNEPNGNLDNYWNQYFVECYDLVRQSNPTRTIIISGIFWANMDMIPQLILPERIQDDPNVMIQFHPYTPSDFCFQGSIGNGFENVNNIRWTGTPAEKKKITDSMDRMLAWAANKKHKRLWAGEFCAQAAAPAAKGSLREDRLLWVRFIREECEKRNISWNYYDFSEEGSKVYDLETGEWDQDLMNALFK